MIVKAKDLRVGDVIDDMGAVSDCIKAPFFVLGRYTTTQNKVGYFLFYKTININLTDRHIAVSFNLFLKACMYIGRDVKEDDPLWMGMLSTVRKQGDINDYKG